MGRLFSGLKVFIWTLHYMYLSNNTKKPNVKADSFIYIYFFFRQKFASILPTAKSQIDLGLSV